MIFTKLWGWHLEVPLGTQEWNFVDLKIFFFWSPKWFAMKCIPAADMERNFTCLALYSRTLVAMCTMCVVVTFFYVLQTFVHAHQWMNPRRCRWPTRWVLLRDCLIFAKVCLNDITAEFTICSFTVAPCLMYFPCILTKLWQVWRYWWISKNRFLLIAEDTITLWTSYFISQNILIFLGQR